MRLPRLPPWWKKAAAGAVVVGAAALLWRRGVRILSYYWQGSDPWGSQQLGFGVDNIADDGCLETSLAHAVGALTGTDYNPGDVNDIAKQAGAFSGSLIELEAAAAAVGVYAPERDDDARGLKGRIRSNAGDVDAYRQRIKDALGKGGVAAVNVAHEPGGQPFHWVLVHGMSVAGNFVAVDPALGKDIHISASTLQADSEWDAQPYVVGVAPIYKAA